MEAKWAGTMYSESSRSNTSLKAFLTPRFAATPPWKATGFTNSFPFPMVLLKFLATA